MKLLLLEFYPERGHRQLFETTCALLSEYALVTALLPKGEAYSCKAEEVLDSPYGLQALRKGSRLRRSIATILYSLRIMRYAAKLDKKNRYDSIICITYNELAFYFGRKFFKNPERLFLMHHNNLDAVANNGIKKRLFTAYVGKVRHIVQCRFIAEYLKKQYGVDEKRVLIWPHPLNGIEKEYLAECSKKALDCVGISNSNDENIIASIICQEEKTHRIKENALHIVLRSREQEYDNGYLKVIRGFLPKEEYDAYIARGKCIFLPFPLDFKNRMSGTLIDAFSNQKPVIGTSFELIKASVKAYPHITKLFSAETFVEDVKSLTRISTGLHREEEFQRFLQLHSSELLGEKMYRQIEAALKNESCSVAADF